MIMTPNTYDAQVERAVIMLRNEFGVVSAAAASAEICTFIDGK